MPNTASAYFLRRIGFGAVTLLVVSALIFTAIHLVPGSYADVVLGPTATEQAKQNFIHEYGLDRPLPIQYVDWLGHVLVGDFGVSLGTNVAVADLLAGWLPVTVELMVLAVAFTLLLGLPLAVAAAMARGRAARAFSRFAGALAISTPDFVIGSALVFLFSRYSLGLSSGGYTPLAEGILPSAMSLALPAFTLGVFGVAVVVRTGRDAMVTALSSPHVLAAVARGETRGHLVRHHILRNSLIPILTVLATYIGYLMGGAVIVENLFALPGLGQAVLNAVTTRDFPVVQGAVLVAAGAFILVNTITDVAYGAIDPRVANGVTL